MFLFMIVCEPQWLNARVLGFHHRVVGSIPALNIVTNHETNALNNFFYRCQCVVYGIYVYCASTVRTWNIADTQKSN